MALTDLFAQNVLVRWLTGNRQRYDLAVAMTAVKLGERLLQVGCSDAGLLAALGAKVGLTGRACGVDTDSGLADRARTETERAGVLVETFAAPQDRFPFDAGSFDVAVIRPGGTVNNPETVTQSARESMRVLRPGGRCVVVASRTHASAPLSSDALVRAVSAAGFRGARVLAERDGWVFVEALKPAGDGPAKRT
jgi:ubiquinone/menaquinone biosynthesis C-methylase UbiE